jgi:SAM-dependent methyltransferase
MAGAPVCARKLNKILTRRDKATAREVFRFLFGPESPLGRDIEDYFVLRIGQPRHVAALALLEQIVDDPRPVLDLGCGAGHFEHYLNTSGRSAIGVDLNYSHIGLPVTGWSQVRGSCAATCVMACFSQTTMAAIVCSDAYHYIPNRVNLVKELERCGPWPDGLTDECCIAATMALLRAA